MKARKTMRPEHVEHHARTAAFELTWPVYAAQRNARGRDLRLVMAVMQILAENDRLDGYTVPDLDLLVERFDKYEKAAVTK